MNEGLQLQNIIKHDEYLSRIIDRKENGLIKVIPGIRRCGKSFLLFNLFYDYLIESGVKEERLQDFEEHFEQAIGENTRLMAANIAETRKFEVKTPDVVVKVNPERTDLVETMEIEGKQYLVIQIDEHLEVNGISVNPETGEVQYNE